MGLNKNTIIVLLVAALAISLYINFNKKEEKSNQAETTIISSNELFKRKQECASYRTSIESSLKEMYFSNQNITTNYTLDEIWFSPSLNTCMYSVNELIEYIKEKEILYAYGIYDTLEYELIDHISEVPNSVSRREALDTFNKLKAEYKQ